LALGTVAAFGWTKHPTYVGAAILFLGVLATFSGFLATGLAARAIADPLRAVRKGLERITGGDLEVHVAVDDGSEVGQLQAGFNRMADGLRERERIRDLFGRQVGRDVAKVALSEGVRLGGEEREISALFVDVVGSTSLALALPPTEVVRLLNRFFRIVIDVVEAEGGLVNKFEGDAALCVFGAPSEHPHAAAAALAAARALHHRLAGAIDGLEGAIGLSAGPVVAGNIGAAQRYEYTVIGDPVNEAARLTELAKADPCRLLASEEIVRRAGKGELARWCLGDPSPLRGLPGTTRVASPVQA
jgi:adenylate cyclase